MATHKLLGSVTSPGSTNVLQFTSIPQNFTDLMVRINVRNTGSTGDTLTYSMNGVGGTNYGWINMYSSGSALTNQVSSSQAAINLTGAVPNSTNTANAFGIATIYISSYTNAYGCGTYQTGAVTANASAGTGFTIGMGYIPAAVGAITSISFSVGTQFVAGSSASLYGIKNS